MQDSLDEIVESISSESDLISTILDFACLEHGAMAIVIKKMHVCIYGECTIDIHQWSTRSMLCWFKHHYEFDSLRRCWSVIPENKVLIH